MANELSTLRDVVTVPPVDHGREQALLAAFDRHWARPRPATGRWAWTIAAAAMIAIAVALNWMVITRPSPVPAMPDETVDMTGFVPWPGAQAWPPFESGELRRVTLPVSMLPALGLTAPAFAVSVVQADVVVGQDGFARAVRLVQ